MVADMPCTLENRIRCCRCGAEHQLGELHFEPAHNLVEPGGAMSPTGHFYCSCDNEHPLAYQQAKNRFILSDPAFAEIID